MTMIKQKSSVYISLERVTKLFLWFLDSTEPQWEPLSVFFGQISQTWNFVNDTGRIMYGVKQI